MPVLPAHHSNHSKILTRRHVHACVHPTRTRVCVCVNSLSPRRRSSSSSSSEEEEEEHDDDSVSLAQYDSTSPLTRFVVSALTTAIGGDAYGDEVGLAQNEDDLRPPVSPQDVRNAIERDFSEGNYLWTGDISMDVYDKGCVFTDPTLSFTGTAAFQRNLERLEPWIEKLVVDPRSELRGPVVLDDSQAFCEARWQMIGELRLPWRPVVNVKGRTRYTLDTSKGGRIVRYDENWELKASEALMQLVTPTTKASV
ncbi:GPI inositol-deacylase [Pycnococcus provasolii]